MLPPNMGGYSAPPYHYGYNTPVTTTAHHSTQYPHQPMQLPTMGSNTPTTPASTANYTPHNPDTTGQVQPPNCKPKLTGTVWEDEGTVCFQVEVNGICVARREDNCFINGTKLLNVANMTRGRRDGILKAEKTRNVVKIGPMHLKGVWIPYDRALEFANKEKITENLYPLFVQNIGPLLAPHFQPLPSANGRNRSETQNSQNITTPQQSNVTQPPASQPLHTSTNSTSTSSTNPPSLAPQPSSGRPELNRAHTFPTPPTSATSVVAGTSQAGSSYNWDGSATSQSLQLDTGINAKSMPATPTTTPPEQQVSALHYGTPQHYDNARGVYSAPPQNSQFIPNHSMPHQPYPAMNPGRKTKEEEADHDKDYAGHAYSSGYGYADHTSHMSPDMKASPHQINSGRATPRSIANNHSGWQGAYGAQQQRPVPSSNLAYVVSETPPNGYPTSTHPNGTSSSNKRGRDLDDDGYGGGEPYKKAKVARDPAAGMSRPQSTMLQRQ